jgi:predicted ArsR family transcriptional regulator
MNPKRINSLSMKEKNRSILFSIIRGGERTRADVARGSGLSRAAVSIIVDQLISEGVLAEGETVKGKVGRSGTVLRFAT